MAANTPTLREENDEKLFHLLAAARDLMKTFKKVLQGVQAIFFLLGNIPRLIIVRLGSWFFETQPHLTFMSFGILYLPNLIHYTVGKLVIFRTWKKCYPHWDLNPVFLLSCLENYLVWSPKLVWTPCTITNCNKSFLSYPSFVLNEKL